MSRWSSPVLVRLGRTGAANGPYRVVACLPKEASRYHYGTGGYGNPSTAESCVVNGPS